MNKSGMKFTEKSELNNFQVQLTTGTLGGKLGRTIFGLLPVFDGKNTENLWSNDSGQWSMKFCVFFGLTCI